MFGLRSDVHFSSILPVTPIIHHRTRLRHPKLSPPNHHSSLTQSPPTCELLMLCMPLQFTLLLLFTLVSHTNALHSSTACDHSV
jgi:hypothetical protein